MLHVLPAARTEDLAGISRAIPKNIYRAPTILPIPLRVTRDHAALPERNVSGRFSPDPRLLKKRLHRACSLKNFTDEKRNDITIASRITRNDFLRVMLLFFYISLLFLIYFSDI